MNSKFGIGVVIAIALQVSAFVWWTAQQAQSIEQLNTQVTELPSRMAIENDITMKVILRPQEKNNKSMNNGLVKIMMRPRSQFNLQHFRKSMGSRIYIR